MGWSDRVNALANYTAMLAAFLMMLQVTADVIAKYVFSMPLDGTEEVVSYYYMIAVVLLPLAAVEAKGEQISVDIVYDRLPRAGRAACNVLARALSGLLFSALTWQSFKQAMESFEVGELSMGAASVVIWPTRFLLPIGFFLVVVVCILRLAQALRRWPEATVPAPHHNEPA